MKNFKLLYILLFLSIALSVSLLIAQYSKDNVVADTDWDAIEFNLENFISFVHHSDVDLVNESLRRGIDINGITDQGETPLFRAVKDDDVDMIHFLLENGAMPDLRGLEGETALLLAVQEGSPNSIKPLLEEGADPYVTDNEGNSLLDYALREGTESAAQTDLTAEALLALEQANIRLPDIPFNEAYSFLAATLERNHPKLTEVALVAGFRLDLTNYEDERRLEATREITRLAFSTDPTHIPNAQMSLCLLSEYTDLTIDEIYANRFNTADERKAGCQQLFNENGYSLIRDSSTEKPVGKTPANPSNESIDLQSIVTKLLEDRVVLIKDTALPIGEPLNEETIVGLFGVPSSIENELYEYEDFRIRLNDGNLAGAAFYNLSDREEDILHMFGTPDSSEEISEYGQRHLSYIDYYDGETNVEAYITLTFIFDSADGSLDYFVIN